MVKGAVHPNTSNFRRVARLDVVSRVRKLCELKLMSERPQWLEWCERVPPLENHNLQLQQRTVRNPYPRMLEYLLKRYPDLRFQDCYVDGNDWSAGNDTYRDDHPAMQFVAQQLALMRQGVSKKDAFDQTVEKFQKRREYLEREQKIMMATALNCGLAPMFTSGKAYLDAERAKAEEAHLNIIRRQLRQKRRDLAEERKEKERQGKLEQGQDPLEASVRQERDAQREAEREARKSEARLRVQLESVTKDAGLQADASTQVPEEILESAAGEPAQQDEVVEDTPRDEPDKSQAKQNPMEDVDPKLIVSRLMSPRPSVMEGKKKLASETLLALSDRGGVVGEDLGSSDVDETVARKQQQRDQSQDEYYTPQGNTSQTQRKQSVSSAGKRRGGSSGST